MANDLQLLNERYNELGNPRYSELTQDFTQADFPGTVMRGEVVRKLISTLNTLSPSQRYAARLMAEDKAADAAAEASAGEDW